MRRWPHEPIEYSLSRALLLAWIAIALAVVSLVLSVGSLVGLW